VRERAYLVGEALRRRRRGRLGRRYRGRGLGSFRACRGVGLDVA